MSCNITYVVIIIIIIIITIITIIIIIIMVLVCVRLLQSPLKSRSGKVDAHNHITHATSDKKYTFESCFTKLEQTLMNRGQLLVNSCYWHLKNDLMDSSKTNNDSLTYNKWALLLKYARAETHHSDLQSSKSITLRLNSQTTLQCY